MNLSSQKRVTVAVVSYNHSRFIVECLESIRKQSIDCEVLIVDDNSTDNTKKVVEEYLTKYPNFATFIPNTVNRGLNRNLNFLLGKAKGEYFTYISADDFMMPGRIEKHLKMLDESSSSQLAYSNAAVADSNSKILEHDSKDEFPWPENQEYWSDAQHALLERNWIPAASIFIKTAFLRTIGGYSEDIYFEDFELLTRAAQYTTFEWVEEQLVAVRRLETSLGATTFGQKNPKFLYASYVAYQNYEHNPHQGLREKAMYLRWNLAVRMIELSTPASENLRLLWSARHGASSKASRYKQLARAITPRTGHRNIG